MFSLDRQKILLESAKDLIEHICIQKFLQISFYTLQIRNYYSYLQKYCIFALDIEKNLAKIKTYLR